jgi:poly(3-hydroxybutyrate) depolymerase
MDFEGETIRYAVFVPASRAVPAPTLLLLHGAGGQGLDMLAAWKAFADEHGIVVVAPTLSLTATQETHVGQLLPAIVDEATRGVGVDPKRTYVFGYSAGGYFAFDAATIGSERFAAVGVFAMIIAPEYVGIVDQAKRKTPIALYIGDHDRFWTFEQVRATRDLLVDHGFPVHYVEIASQDHAYLGIADQVNRDAWAYMSRTALP